MVWDWDFHALWVMRISPGINQFLIFEKVKLSFKNPALPEQTFFNSLMALKSWKSITFFDPAKLFLVLGFEYGHVFFFSLFKIRWLSVNQIAISYNLYCLRQNAKKPVLFFRYFWAYKFILWRSWSWGSKIVKGSVGFSKETTLERADFALQLSMFVTAEKEREMFTIFFLSSFCQLMSPWF